MEMECTNGGTQLMYDIQLDKQLRCYVLIPYESETRFVLLEKMLLLTEKQIDILNEN